MLCVCRYFVVVFFFFKQKTAYEMRISDWSSDVCSSDLVTYADALAYAHWLGRELPSEAQWEFAAKSGRDNTAADRALRDAHGHPLANFWQGLFPLDNRGDDRSEEHTSELQSLMRISYAVFCLKKKTINNNQQLTQIQIKMSTYEQTVLNTYSLTLYSEH